MTYCIEVNRRGIGEENVVLHYDFDENPTREKIVELLLDEDMGYDDHYCKFDYYRVN
jgi:hypothetical protein